MTYSPPTETSFLPEMSLDLPDSGPAGGVL
jgi:hypothetical protein